MFCRVVVGILLLCYGCLAVNYGSTNQQYNGGYNSVSAGSRNGFTNQYQNYGYNYKGKFYNNYPMSYNAYYNQNQGFHQPTWGHGYGGSNSHVTALHSHTVVPVPYPIPSHHHGYTGVPVPVPAFVPNPYLGGGRDWLGSLLSSDTGRLLGTVAAGTLIFKALG